MNNSRESENFIENILNDEYVFVTGNSLDEDKDTGTNWIELAFTENDLKQYQEQNYKAHKHDAYDNTFNEISPSRWKVMKERADTAARLVIAVPITVAMVAVSAGLLPPFLSFYVCALMDGFLLDDPDSIFAKLHS